MRPWTRCLRDYFGLDENPGVMLEQFDSYVAAGVRPVPVCMRLAPQKILREER